MTKETLIFGHKNPDTDSITSALVMENLEKKLGNENAKAVRLGNVNKETQYVLKSWYRSTRINRRCRR